MSVDLIPPTLPVVPVLPQVVNEPGDTAQATAKKEKTCTRLIHNGVERVPCATVYKGVDCPKWRDHVSRYKTGFCGNGFCEGTKPKSFRGTPMKTCDFFMTCACSCHKMMDDMYKLAEMDRTAVDNPEYIPDRGGFIMPDPDELPSKHVAFSDGDPEDPDGSSGATTGKIRLYRGDLAARRTETGRAARGGLEAQVWEITSMFIEKGMTGLITPKIAAEMIADKWKIPTPSTGAIQAVWERWAKLEYAKPMLKKPVRFDDFTGERTWEALLKIKSRASREARKEKNPNRRYFA